MYRQEYYAICLYMKCLNKVMTNSGTKMHTKLNKF